MCWWQVYNINLSNKYWIHLKVTLTVYKVDSYGTAWLHYAGHHRPIQHFHVDLTMTHAWFSLQILLYRCPWLIAFHPQLKFWKSLLIVVFRQPHMVFREIWSHTKGLCSGNCMDKVSKDLINITNIPPLPFVNTRSHYHYHQH